MFKRILATQLLASAKGFPIVAIVGPRQSGKTTLAKMAFPKYQYVSLENIDNRTFAEEDPRGFLQQYDSQVILDEVQNTPTLFSFLQQIVDEAQQPGQYILTGSHHFLMLEKITQSLAGRVALLTLLPLSMQELDAANALPKDANELIFKGGYPRTYQTQVDASHWYENYITTYLERDVRQIVNVNNLSTFQRFLRLCAGRCGQLLNYSELANDAGVAVHTIKSWISILEASFILYTLQPHHRNFNKRIIKSPKLYFYDTALACSLLGIETHDQLQQHYLRGGLFENMIITELLKQRYNQGKRSNLYFWRDKTGHEVDCIQEQADQLIPIEIKSTHTFNPSLLKGLNYFQELADTPTARLIYGGNQTLQFQDTQVYGWRHLAKPR